MFRQWIEAFDGQAQVSPFPPNTADHTPTGRTKPHIRTGKVIGELIQIHYRHTIANAYGEFATNTTWLPMAVWLAFQSGR